MSGARRVVLDPEEIAAAPDVYERLFFARNARWLVALRDRLAEGAVVCAVGLGHLLGDRGVLAELEREGFTVERLTRRADDGVVRANPRLHQRAARPLGGALRCAMADLTLGRAAPSIPVSDVDAAVRFYRDAFGLDVTFENGDPVSYVVMKKDAAEVHLARCSDPAPRMQNVMHLIVSDAEEVQRRCVNAGGAIVEALRDAPWGMRTFVVGDPDGHRIDVGQPLGDE